MKKFSKLLQIEQTILALPLAYLGLLFAGGDEISTWFWVTIAIVSACIAGVSINQVIDADLDAENPRTRDRLLPRGELGKAKVWIIGIIFSIILIFSSYMLNRLSFYFSFIIIFLIVTHPFLKRFSSLSHFYLGIIEAAAPICGFLAVTGRFGLIPPVIIAAAVFMWTSGLDIIYSFQDVEFDENEGLFSIPVKLGKERALMTSVILYILAIIAFITAGVLASSGIAYWVSIICVIIIFFKQQSIARSGDMEILMVEYFQINRFISPALFIGSFIDVMSK